MKATTFLCLSPAFVALACSSNSSSNGGSSTNGSSDAGGDSGLSSGGGDSGKGGSDASAEAEAGGGGGGPMPTPYEAVLSGANVSPAAVQTTATGDAKFTLEIDNQTLDYDITQNVQNATAVNLHIGAPLESGAVTHQLTPVSQHMTGKVMLTNPEITALPMGQMYLDVPSQANPGGEVRGQVAPPGAAVYVAKVTGDQELPNVTSMNTGHASFIVTNQGGTVMFHVKTTATPTNVLLERGIATINGQIVYSLTPLGATIDGQQGLMPMDAMDFQAGHFYVNIQTAANPTGELRGQVIPPGAALYSGPLAGSNEVPPVSTMATGGAQFVLSPDLTTINYEIVVNGIIPISAEFDQGALGSTGSMISSLTLDQTGALGMLTLASSYLSSFQGGSTYVNVHTASYPNGEVRAQLVQH